MKLIAALCVTVAMIAGTGAARAQVSAGVHAGTAGLGADLQYRLNDNVVLRGAADFLDFNYSRDYNNIRYDGKLKLGTGGAFVDWHPWANAFFVSGGAYFGDRRIDINATPSINVSIGGVTYTAVQVGRLTGRIKMASAAPFAGLGFDTSSRGAGKGLGFKGLVGVAFSGEPTVDLTANGGLLSALSPLLGPELAVERDRIARDARFLQTYPVAQVGVMYRF